MTQSAKNVQAADPNTSAPASSQEHRGHTSPGWRRCLTASTTVLLPTLTVLTLVLLQRHGFLLTSPSGDALQPSARGAVAADFELPGVTGEPLRLSRFRGQVVLVNFWATWCPPCRAEMPSIERLYRVYRSRGFEILAVAEDRVGRSVVEGYRRDLGLTFPILLDGSGVVAGRYGVRGLPTTVLVDREGRIVTIDVGARDWSGKGASELIESLLGEKSQIR